MWNPRRPALCAVAAAAVLALGLPATGLVDTVSDAAGASTGGATGREERAIHLEHQFDTRSLAPQSRKLTRDADRYGKTFVGLDGETYGPSPLLVEGSNGTLYYGEEFDGACIWGENYQHALGRLAKLAHVIARSGRDVVFTVGPNKSAVNKADLPTQLPHGACDAAGIAGQDQTLDSFRDTDYLATRSTLADKAATGREVYWHIDTHWTSVGGTEFAMALARRLSPKVAELQSYRAKQETILVDLNFVGLLSGVYETGGSRRPTTKVRVVPVGNSAGFDVNHPSASLKWTTSPEKRTVGGKTLLLGDSFMYRAMGSLMPLFGHGRFIWIGNRSMEETLRAIRHADTVVLEGVQRYLPLSLQTSEAFRRQVRMALLPQRRPDRLP